MSYINLNPEGSPQASSKYSMVLKHTQSRHKRTIKTLPDQSTANSPHAQHKGSVLPRSIKKMRTENPQNRLYISLNIKKKKKYSEKLPDISLANIKTTNESKIQSELLNNPYLNGRLKKKRENKLELLNDTNQILLLQEIIKRQYQYLLHCTAKRYKEAAEIIVILFNYSVDLNLIGYFSKSLFILGDFYIICNMLDEAFFYMNEARKSYFDIGKYHQLLEVLMKMAEISTKAKMYTEAIKILKKALQYAWYYQQTQYELNIYQEIGKNYFLMGNISKAKQFHMRYFMSELQPNASALKVSSKESLLLEGIEQRKIDQEVTKLSIIKTSAPIKKYSAIPRYQSSLSIDLRGGYQRDLKYFQFFKEVKTQIAQIFQQKFFMNEMEQVSISDKDWTIPLRQQKYLSFDIQRNKHLQQLGIPFKQYFMHKNKGIKQRYKQSHSEIKDVDKWCSKIAIESKHYQQMSKNGETKTRVQVRGIDGSSKGKLSDFKVSYYYFFDQ